MLTIRYFNRAHLNMTEHSSRSCKQSTAIISLGQMIFNLFLCYKTIVKYKFKSESSSKLSAGSWVRLVLQRDFKTGVYNNILGMPYSVVSYFFLILFLTITF